jgi:Ca2+-transporting ATPase
MMGKQVYKNVQKFLTFNITTTIMIGLVNIFFSFHPTHIPLNIVQLLWVNIIIEILGAIAFSSEKWDKNNEYEPPRDKLFSGELWRTVIT